MRAKTHHRSLRGEFREEDHRHGSLTDSEQLQHQTYLRELVSYLIGQFQPKVVLDIGCGSGEIVGIFRERGVCAFGFDPSLTFLSRCPKAAQGYVWQGFADRGGIPCRDNSVDMIVAHHVLEHLVDPEGFLLEAIRILHPGGILIAVIPVLPFRAWILPKLLHIQQTRGHASLHTKRWWQKRFTQNGFRLQSDFRNIVKKDPTVFSLARALNRFGCFGRYLSMRLLEVTRASFVVKRFS